MQVLSPPRRALGGAALLLSAGAHLSAPGPAHAQETAAKTPPPPAITMTLESPLARPENDSLAPSMEDPRLNSGTDREGVRARPLSIVSRFGRWFPVAVNLSNIGPDASVTLSMRLLANDPSQAGSVSSFDTRVELPRGSSKRVWIYGRLERGVSDTGQIVLSGRGVESLSRTFALASPDPTARVVWTISDSGENLPFLAPLQKLRAKSISGASYDDYGRSLAIKSGRAVDSLGATSSLVPEKWIGLDSVDVVTLTSPGSIALSPVQADALRGYVAAGGSLLVVGEAARLLTRSPLRDLAPVQATGTSDASPGQKKALASLLEKEISYSKYLLSLRNKNSRTQATAVPSLSGPLTMTSADELEGATLPITEARLEPTARALMPGLRPELAAVKKYGAGRVVWLAFDPSTPEMRDWRGQEALWTPIMSGLAQPRRIDGVDSRLQSASTSSSYSYSNTTGDSLLDSLRAALSRSPQLRTPAASSIAWFLALYVFFLVPVNYVVLRFVDRRELAWVTVPVIVLAFSTLSYAAAVRIKGTELRTRQVAIVQGSDAAPLARADSMLWVFSPRKATYSIAGRDAQGQRDAAMVSAVYADGRRSDVLDNSQVAEGAGGFSTEDSPINMWDYKSFVGQSVVPTGGGFALETVGGKRVLTNKSGQELLRAAWIENGKIYDLGDLAPGRSSELPVAGRAQGMGLSHMANLASTLYNFDSAGTGTSIASAALSAAGVDASLHADSKYPAPTLVAWQGRPATGLGIEGQAPVRESVSLWVWRFTK